MFRSEIAVPSRVRRLAYFQNSDMLHNLQVEETPQRSQGFSRHLKQVNKSNETCVATGFTCSDAIQGVGSSSGSVSFTFVCFLVECLHVQLTLLVFDAYRSKWKFVSDCRAPTIELCPEDGVLGGDPHWAGVGVALSHHDAAQCDEGSCGEAKLLCTKHGSDGHVTPSTQLTVHLKHKEVTCQGYCSHLLPQFHKLKLG